MTVGEIAAQSPASIRVFEKHRIDYCCGGGLAVGEACAARGLNAAEVLQEVDGAAGPAVSADWRSAQLGSLIEHIVENHHGYLKAHLPRMASMLEKILAKHSERHGDTLRPLAATFRGLKEELEAHLMKEEMILFPLIRSMEATQGAAGGPAAFHCGSVQNPIRVMLMEHDSAGEALARMRQLTSGYTPPEDACNTFRGFYFELAEMERDLHVHIHLENNILFPRAVALQG
ncbi:MAG: iron-sulfur cluster repair di-iron protein [Acidobacteriia bacterium]|nr:iron-sulfur cluster repair di-iron protein [Terriglobia bacterium]